MRRPWSTLRSLSLAFLVTFLLALVGCFDDSPVPVGPRPEGQVDRRFVGNWSLETRDDAGEVQTSRLVIRNLHDREYYIEWQTGNEEPFRATGWLNAVGEARFASLSPMDPEGEVADTFLIVRIDPDGEGFRVRNLSGDFFDGKPLKAPEDLRAVLEKHLNDEQMYTGEPLEATREAK